MVLALQNYPANYQVITNHISEEGTMVSYISVIAMLLLSDAAALI